MSQFYKQVNNLTTTQKIQVSI